MPRRKLTFEIFLISLAVILLEVGYTRVFSYKLVYYFTYVIIGISLLCVSLFYLIKKRNILATVFLSLSFLAKLYPAILLPLYLKRFWWNDRANGKPGWVAPLWNLSLFLAIALLFYLPFLSIGSKNFAGLKAFSLYWQSNDSIFSLLLYFLRGIPGFNSLSFDFITYNLPLLLGKLILASVLLGVLIYLVLQPFSEDDSRDQIVRQVFILMAFIFLLSPVQNPWYLCWVVPFLCFHPWRSWILLTGLVGLYYLDFYFDYQDIRQYSPWVPWLEYSPFYLLLLLEMRGWRTTEKYF